MSVLHDICMKKIAHIEMCKSQVKLAELKAQAKDVPAPKGFIKAIKNAAAPAIIAEVKKASPSKGIIRSDFDAGKIAKIYEQNGAACLSVLTDSPYFQGSDEDFRAARAAASLPILRKDFMIDPYQIYESRALGADCILLIMAALDDDLAAELHELASDLGMDVLVEIHDEEELERAKSLKPPMIGINNRNLKTLKVDVQTSFDLVQKMPPDAVKVAESGLTDFATLQRLGKAGFDCFLIGESLMREADIGAALRQIRNQA
jgi:indole-3-glycerol phosphate synthase